MHILGYIIAVLVIVAALGILGHRIYRRIAGRTSASGALDCGSCNCHPTGPRLSVSMEAQTMMRENDQGDGHEGESDETETFSGK
jgi:hypothetical protein